MARYSERLGRLVQEALERHKMSPRDVARLSEGKISHMTVNEMSRGSAASPRKIVVLALILGEDPDRFLEAAGEPFRYTGERDLASVIYGTRVSEALAA